MAPSGKATLHGLFSLQEEATLATFLPALEDYLRHLQAAGYVLRWRVEQRKVLGNFDRGLPEALVQLNGDNFLFYNKSLGDLNVEKFTHKHPRSVDGVNDVWHAYPHSSRNLHDIGIARKLDWRLYKRLF